ncbi:MAG: hypothetical protein L0H19_04945, partial [Salinisphaera sp.]|nr:hypothetical protein [Salinisphaera sp.]
MRALAGLALLWLASASAAAPSPDSLLAQVRAAVQDSHSTNVKREARFLANKHEQARLLANARATLAPVQAKTKALRGQYDKLQDAIPALRKKIAEAAGDLNELTAVVRAAAVDLQQTARGSLITAQYPERMAALDRLATSRQVPTAADLKTLWSLLEQQIAAAGQVAGFTAPVTMAADDGSAPTPVVRVGPFV